MTSEVYYRVVMNTEEQYSVWPSYRDIPDGWCEEGVTGSKEDCLDRIKLIWTDLRPKSLRDQLSH